MPPYTPDWDEVKGDEVLLEAACRHLVEVSLAQARPGDVLLFRMREGAVAKHLGILASDSPSFIHAYSGHGVVESALTAPWGRRVAGIFSFPDTD